MKKLFIIGGCLLLSLLLLSKWHGKSKAPFRLYQVAIGRHYRCLSATACLMASLPKIIFTIPQSIHLTTVWP